ncbi:helix-turn-helix transcriptional regulator [Streptomyces sp. G-G2]|uniref:helix-turn-helix domain-containing protein n=1 Tax=Streptomyces sp. G-G2 TaxID=3046201 RepID=UPI0024BA7B3B|nr:helix-turn-helix transcriptional regulator [Streptomyces sp. G-G2]MDJ0384447.1 helix-turn-helix transcriptional regulator [Streptomyces sp. G-G2]
MTQRRFDDEDEDDFPEWVDRIKNNVAGEVRRRRKEMRWSAQRLAERCEELGHPIPRNVIANLESGRRANLPLVDVMVLAAALYTSPICLIFPVGYVEQTQELPFQHLIPTWDAMRKFTGEQPGHDSDAGLIPDFNRHANLVRTIEAALYETERADFATKTAATPAEREEAERRKADYAKRAKEDTQQLLWVRESIRDEDATPPDLPPALAAIDPPDIGTDEEDDI